MSTEIRRRKRGAFVLVSCFLTILADVSSSRNRHVIRLRGISEAEVDLLSVRIHLGALGRVLEGERMNTQAESGGIQGFAAQAPRTVHASRVPLAFFVASFKKPCK